MNFQTYGKGTITNVRRGVGRDSDLLLADIIVYNLAQIEEIESKQKREVSCGYECEYVPYKDGYAQKNIIGNHVALVNAGRAGSRVAIKDNKINEFDLIKLGENSAYVEPLLNGGIYYLVGLGKWARCCYLPMAVFLF